MLSRRAYVPLDPLQRRFQDDHPGRRPTSRRPLTLATPDGPEPVTSGDYFAGKRVRLFAVPGAFTPTCSARHLPSYVEKAAELKAKGVDEIACISVNDAVRDGSLERARRIGRHHHARRRQRRLRRRRSA